MCRDWSDVQTGSDSGQHDGDSHGATHIPSSLRYTTMLSVLFATCCMLLHVAAPACLPACYHMKSDFVPKMTLTCTLHVLSQTGQRLVLRDLTLEHGQHSSGTCCCRYTAGKRKGPYHASPAKRMALTQEVPVTCGSSSGVYDIRRGCISLRAAQHGQVCLPLCLNFLL